MAVFTDALVVLDFVSAALALIVALFFIASWRRSGQRNYLLFAVGFVLFAMGLASSTTSQFNLQGDVGAWDALRFGAHTGASLVLAMAYLSARRHGAARPIEVLGWASAGVALLFILLYAAVPPVSELANFQTTSAAAHLLQFVAFGVCLIFSLEGFRYQPRIDNALVPAAFLSIAFSKYTWMLIDLTGDSGIVPIVFVWRYAALVLMLLALGLPAAAAWRGDDPASA